MWTKRLSLRDKRNAGLRFWKQSIVVWVHRMASRRVCDFKRPSSRCMEAKGPEHGPQIFHHVQHLVGFGYEQFFSVEWEIFTCTLYLPWKC
ncbi:unnamed protein product [Caretta caretta]